MINKIVKSADIIGVMQVRITQEHVGQIFGRFVSREIKAAGWKWRGTPHEVAQAKWAEMINLLGGDAAIVSGTGSLEAYRK